MDFLKLLSVVSEYIESFMHTISYLDTLYLAGIVYGIGTVLIVGHILLSAKARTNRSARSMSRYFERVYIGSSYEAGKFYKKKHHLMNRQAKEEFNIFVRSTAPITNTDFVDAVLRKGRYSLAQVMTVHAILSIIVETFILFKGILTGLDGVMLFVYSVVPFACMMILHYVIYACKRLVERSYVKNAKRLSRAVTYIDFNMYTHSFGLSEERRRSVSYLTPERKSNIEEFATRLENADRQTDIDSDAIVDDAELDSLLGSIEGSVSNM